MKAFLVIKSLITVLLLLSLVKGQAQNDGRIFEEKPVDSYTVQWVDQYPSEKSNSKKSNSNWFMRFFFGEKNSLDITKPIAIVAEDKDLYFILDQANGLVFNIEDSKKHIPKVFKKNSNKFTSLVGLCTLPDNKLAFTDSRLEKVFILNLEENSLNILKDKLSLQQPTGIAYSSISKEIWVVETAAHRIAVLNEQGELIKTIGKRGNASGEFNFPTSIWIDKSGKVYVVDTMNFRIQVFNKNAEVISVFGEQGSASGFFASPKGIATDSFGNIYVVDALYHTVQIFDISGNFLYQFGEQGRGKAQFWMPFGIYIDKNNYIYIADTYNSRVQIFQLIKAK